MRVLVVGEGVEDPQTRAWAHVYDALRRMPGIDARRFDPILAEVLALKGSAADQIAWIVDDLQPHVALVVGPEGSPIDQTSNFLVESSVEVARVRLDDSAGQSLFCNVELLASGPPITRGWPNVDVLIVSDSSTTVSEVARQLESLGLDVLLYGQGWDDEPTVRHLARSRLPYPYMSAVFGSTVATLILDQASSAVLEAAAAGSPIVEMGTNRASDMLGESAVLGARTVEEVAEQIARLKDPSADPGTTSIASLRVEQQYSATSLLSSITGHHGSPIRVTKDGPVVTYITASYNIAEYVGPALESLLNQTVSDIEILVTNDGSSDSSASVIRKYQSDPRVRLIEQANVGQTGRFDLLWSRALHESRGTYVANLGGDDIAIPERTALQLEVFESDPATTLVHGAAMLIDETGGILGPTFGLATTYDSTSLLRKQLYRNLIAMPTIMLKRSFFDSVGWFAGGYAGDYDLWIRLARVERARYLPLRLVDYRTHQKSASTGPGTLNSANQGTLTRLREIGNTSLVDMFPTLRNVGPHDERAWAAALVDVGVGHLSHLLTPHPALDCFLEAAALVGKSSPVPIYNAGVASLMCKDEVQARACFDQAHQIDSRLGWPANINELTLLSPEAISDIPFRAIGSSSQVTAWDGLPVDLKRILLLVDWNVPNEMSSVLDSYFAATNATDDIDLAIATLGTATSDCLAAFMAALPTWVDLEHSASVTLEQWDEPAYLPADRFAAVLDLRTQTTKSISVLLQTTVSKLKRYTMPESAAIHG